MAGPDPELAVSVLAAFDDMPVGVLIVRFPVAGPPRRVYVNPAAARLYEGTVEELLAMPVPLRIAAHDRSRFVAMQEDWLGGKPFDELVEVDIETVTGQIVPILVRSAGGQIGDDRIRISFLQDLRPRRRSETALRASEELFRRLAEAAPDAMIVIADGVLRYANLAAVRTLGHERAEALIGTAAAAMLTPEDARIMAARVQRQLAGETLPAREYPVRRRDGVVITLEISSTPIVFAGAPAILAVGRDVDQRKRQQAELIRADRMAAVGTLAAGVAHEINNPLTYVVLQLDRLRGRRCAGWFWTPGGGPRSTRWSATRSTAAAGSRTSCATCCGLRARTPRPRRRSRWPSRSRWRASSRPRRCAIARPCGSRSTACPWSPATPRGSRRSSSTCS